MPDKVQTTLHVLRERSLLTQTDLAEILGRQQPEVSMWEWGKERMPDTIKQQVFGVLRAALARVGADARHLRPEDLDRPWDDVLHEWRDRAAQQPKPPADV